MSQSSRLILSYVLSIHPPSPLSDPQVFNIATRKPDGSDNIFIGRPSTFGNIFTVSEYGREKAIELFEDYLFNSGLIEQIGQLKGKNLICFCKPKKCHGDILLKLANSKLNIFC